MTPGARYMILCEDARVDPARSKCVNIDCLLSNIVSHEDPPFPLLREEVCVYMVLTDCVGNGVGHLRLVDADSEPEVEISRSPAYPLDFTGHTPLELLGVICPDGGLSFSASGNLPHPVLVQFGESR